ncbi:DEAD/DEAH box helicase [Microgenomates group bacterium]|nr:DEAD/DEAH box helicase [Microgenomates group bacterium]
MLPAKTLTLVLSNEITIPLPKDRGLWWNEVRFFLRKQLNFPNPKIFDLQRMGFSIWKVPRSINCFTEKTLSWHIPLGFLPELLAFAASKNIEVSIKDQRILSPIPPVTTDIIPRASQEKVLTKILTHDRAILEAKPGFGKTMAALLVFAQRQQKTLVIVHTRTLLNQWKKRVEDHFTLEEGDLGIIGEGKWHLGSKITIASYQTLLSRGTTSIVREFGQVIIDEAHHVPSATFTKIARSFCAHYYLGLSATPFRKDKLDKLMTFFVGPIISSGQSGSKESLLQDELLEGMTIPDNAQILSSDRLHLSLTSTAFSVPNPDLIDFVQLGSLLVEDLPRNQLILKDIAEGIKRQGKILILTERVKHAQLLHADIHHLHPDKKLILVTGQTDKKEREALYPKIKNNDFEILVATGAIIGEGFDWPDLDHLYLVYPFSWKGKLIQYVGRVQRLSEHKTSAYIYDYLDLHVPMLRAMGRSRARAYRNLGIKLPPVS